MGPIVRNFVAKAESKNSRMNHPVNIWKQSFSLRKNAQSGHDRPKSFSSVTVSYEGQRVGRRFVFKRSSLSLCPGAQ